jgi:hypothetical protein
MEVPERYSKNLRKTISLHCEIHRIGKKRCELILNPPSINFEEKLIKYNNKQSELKDLFDEYESKLTVVEEIIFFRLI